LLLELLLVDEYFLCAAVRADGSETALALVLFPQEGELLTAQHTGFLDLALNTRIPSLEVEGRHGQNVKGRFIIISYQ
jgi:hypothetical protein